MPEIVEVPSPLGLLRLRPERAGDEAFRFRLFCESRPAEWDAVRDQPALFEQLMRHQFQAQKAGYCAQFPQARFDIIELANDPIGRIVVDRPGKVLHIVDQAIVPNLRRRGLGTTIMRALMEEAAEVSIPVRLCVDSRNDPSLRLYLRLGFTPVEETQTYIELEWRAKPAESFTN